MKELFWNYALRCLLAACFLVGVTAAPCYAQASRSEFEQLQVKYNLAKSDYLEAIASCNGALRKSAERQMDKILSDLSRMKDRAKEDYEKMSRRLNQIYQELTQFFDDPNAAKAFLDIAMNYVPVIGNAYSITNTIYDYAGKHVQNDQGREIFNRAKQQIREMEKMSKEYNDWKEFEQNVQERKARLARQFDENCRGRDTGEWRYDTDLGVQEQAGVTDTSLSGRDTASGQVFEGTTRNNTGDPVTFGFPGGTVIFPPDPGSQRMTITGPSTVMVPPGESVTFPVNGFCLDPFSYPPSPGDNPQNWFIGESPGIVPNGNPFNGDFTRIPTLPQTVPGLIENGTIPPTGLPPAMELDTIIQWTIWNIMENFTPDDGREKITEQVRESGGTQTPEQISQLNENIWGGVNLVKKETRSSGQASDSGAIFQDGFESGDTSAWSSVP